MRSSTVTRRGLPLLLALAAVLTMPVTSLGGNAIAVGAANALRPAVSPATGPISYGKDGRLTLLLIAIILC